MTDNDKPKLTVSSLADLSPRQVMVEIERDQDVLTVPCRMLSYGEWQRLGYEVLDPEPPFLAGPKGKIYDYNDPNYQRTVKQMADERTYRRLLAFVDIEIPGKTVEEKIEHLRDGLEFGVLNQLVTAMMRVAVEGRARVEARAEAFQRA